MSKTTSRGIYIGSLKVAVYLLPNDQIETLHETDLSVGLVNMQAAMSQKELLMLDAARRGLCARVAEWFMAIRNPDKPVDAK